MALKGHYLATSELSEKTDMSVGTTRYRLSELQALKIADFMSSKTAGAEEDFEPKPKAERFKVIVSFGRHDKTT